LLVRNASIVLLVCIKYEDGFCLPRDISLFMLIS
jgi:hypothetical protein